MAAPARREGVPDRRSLRASRTRPQSTIRRDRGPRWVNRGGRKSPCVCPQAARARPDMAHVRARRVKRIGAPERGPKIGIRASATSTCGRVSSASTERSTVPCSGKAGRQAFCHGHLLSQDIASRERRGYRTAMTTRAYDVIVIGAGPTGENVAARTVRGGLSTVIVESELVGGECSYWACMPSKALLRPAQALTAARAVDGARQGAIGALDAAATL